MINLSWKNGLFSNTTKIYSNDQLVGQLNHKTFSQTTECELNGEKYKFVSKGFFKVTTEIFGSSASQPQGEIKYGNWSSKATIALNGKSLDWKYDNMWNTKWHISDADGLEIEYAGSSNKGSITTNADSPMLILSGLYIYYHYYQISIAVFASLIAVFAATISNI